MYFNMDNWSREIIAAPDRRFLPVLYFPCVGLCDYSVLDTVTDGAKMAQVMAATIDRFPEIIASMSGMDLTIDAEAFGAPVRFKRKDVPCLAGTLVNSEADIAALQVPDAHAGRQDVHYQAVSRAQQLAPDRPVFGGQLGPFSLAANLMDLTEALIATVNQPAKLHLLLEKATAHLIDRARAYKRSGANGVLLAEPTAGLLSPACCHEFSSRYVKQLVDAVQDSSFYVILHNCGNVTEMCDSMYGTGARGYHFGNAVDMVQICRQMPADVLVFGNISPAEIHADSPQVLREKCDKLLADTAAFPNFVFSSGCDIPTITTLDKIQVMIDSCRSFNARLG